MRHRLFLLLAMSLSACRGKPAESKNAGTLPLKPNPVKVSVKRDSLQASSATIGTVAGPSRQLAATPRD